MKKSAGTSHPFVFTGKGEEKAPRDGMRLDRAPHGPLYAAVTSAPPAHRARAWLPPTTLHLRVILQEPLLPWEALLNSLGWVSPNRSPKSLDYYCSACGNCLPYKTKLCKGLPHLYMQQILNDICVELNVSIALETQRLR